MVFRLDGSKESVMKLYALHQARPHEEKLKFYEQLLGEYNKTNAEVKIFMDDFNAQEGRNRVAVKSVMGAHSEGDRNLEEERLLDLAVGNRLTIMNSFFVHSESHKWSTYCWDSVIGEYTDKLIIDLILTNERKL